MVHTKIGGNFRLLLPFKHWVLSHKYLGLGLLLNKISLPSLRITYDLENSRGLLFQKGQVLDSFQVVPHSDIIYLATMVGMFVAQQ